MSKVLYFVGFIGLIISIMEGVLTPSTAGIDAHASVITSYLTAITFMVAGIGGEVLFGGDSE